MTDDGVYASLLDRLYSAALDPAAWAGFVRGLGDAYRGGIEVVRIDLGDGPRAAEDAAASDSGALGGSLARSAAMDGFLACLVATRDEAASANADPKLHDTLSVVVAKGEDFLVQLTLTRPKAAEGFSPAERARWQQLAPHVQRAVRIRQELVAAHIERDSVVRGLDALSVGVAIADEDGRLLFANATANEYFSRGEGLIVRKGRIRPPAVQQRDGFLRILRDAAYGDRDNPGLGELLPLPRTTAGQPLAALISPLPTSSAAGFRLHAALIFLGDPIRDLMAREKDLTRLYGLTAAEAKLLRSLLNGAQLADHATATGISVNTAKTHLRQIFGKTGHSRQTDLVRTILSDPILWLAAAERDTGPG